MKANLRPIILTALLATVAFAQDVRYNFEQGTDFSKFKTYKWVDISGASKVDSLTENQLRSAIDAELAKKGLTKTDADSADLYIGSQTALGQEKQLNTYNTGWGYGPGWRGGWYGGGTGMSTTTTSTITTGSLDLDMYNPATKQLVWRGVVSKTLDTNAKPEKRQKNIAKAIAKLLKNYPPPVKK